MGQSATDTPLYKELALNEHELKSIFKDCSDVVFRYLRIMGSHRALLVFMDGLVDVSLVDQMLLNPLLHCPNDTDSQLGILSYLEHEAISLGHVSKGQHIKHVTTGILNGEAAILIDGIDQALILDVKGWKSRSIEEPSSEAVIRGPREGFNEDIRTSTALLRKRLRTPQLKMQSLKVGDLSNTEIVITYIEGVAKNTLIQEVKERLSRIQLDGVLESGYIEEMIEDAPHSIFPTIQNTERPDVVIAHLLEGKVAILVDNTPFALIVPISFFSAMNSNDDYYERYWMGTMIRWIRYTGVLITLFLPSFYVAVTTFHQEMIPTELLRSIVASKEATPFPTLVEALLMEFTFEMLREAGIRLPRQVGQAVSIVGALVIGQAGVEAGIISAPMVIIVAFTGIASFITPQFNVGISLRMLRFPFIVMSGCFGLYGLSLSSIFILVHLCSLRSFGTAYFAPLAPMSWRDLKDTVVRAPWWSMNHRPRHPGSQIKKRISKGQKPGPSKH